MSDESSSVMLDEMESFPDRLARLIERLDAVRTAQRPSEEEWSPAEVVAHLRDVDEIYGQRIARSLAEDNP
ncbi:MAG TPA: DinB family protein, partial [Herpetosiphonaceae bacterium]|nr:DinB family protein [Herpetosiphonaceae bacterium]